MLSVFGLKSSSPSILDKGTFKVPGTVDEGKVPDLRDAITDPEIKRQSKMGLDPEDIMEGQEAIATDNARDIRPRTDERLKKEVKMTMPRKGRAIDFGQKELSKRARKNKRKRMFARKVEALKMMAEITEKLKGDMTPEKMRALG